MIVKITKVSKPFYWYKHLIGEYMEVRLRLEYRLSDSKFPLGFGEQFYTVIEDRKTERFIHFDDCVECTRFIKLKKIKDKIKNIS